MHLVHPVQISSAPLVLKLDETEYRKFTVNLLQVTEEKQTSVCEENGPLCISHLHEEIEQPYCFVSRIRIAKAQ